MGKLDQMFPQISLLHFPEPPSSRDSIVSCEARLGSHLPAEMKRFYQYANGASFFDKHEPPFRIMPLDELCHPSIRILRKDQRTDSDKGLIAFCDVQDDNFVAVDSDGCSGRIGQIIDCFHETFPDPDYLGVVAKNFSGFLSGVMANNGMLFWL
jgi:cell wall assembly regulator SMI1